MNKTCPSNKLNAWTTIIYLKHIQDNNSHHMFIKFPHWLLKRVRIKYYNHITHLGVNALMITPPNSTGISKSASPCRVVRFSCLFATHKFTDYFPAPLSPPAGLHWIRYNIHQHSSIRALDLQNIALTRITYHLLLRHSLICDILHTEGHGSMTRFSELGNALQIFTTAGARVTLN